MKTGSAAHDSGMRGGEKPKSAGGSAKPGKIRDFRVEGSKNGGFAVHINREQKASKPGEVSDYQGPEMHVHPHKAAMVEHVGALADEMGGAAEKEKGVEQPDSGKTAPNPKTE